MNDMTMNTSETGPETSSCSVSRKLEWRHVEVTERRTAVDFAHQMRWPGNVRGIPSLTNIDTAACYGDSTVNTHKLGSLYDVFEP